VIDRIPWFKRVAFGALRYYICPGAQCFSQYLPHCTKHCSPRTTPLYCATLKEIVFLGVSTLSPFLPSPYIRRSILDSKVTYTAERQGEDYIYIDTEADLKSYEMSIFKIQFPISDIFTAVIFKVKVLWIVMPCSVVVRYRRFGGPCCCQLQGEDR
jgi:hypothetical protein